MHWSGLLFGAACAGALWVNLRRHREQHLRVALLLTASWAVSNLLYVFAFGSEGPYLLMTLDGVVCGAVVLLHCHRPRRVTAAVLLLFGLMFACHIADAARKTFDPNLYPRYAYYVALNVLFALQLAAVAAPNRGVGNALASALLDPLRAFSRAPRRRFVRSYPEEA